MKKVIAIYLMAISIGLIFGCGFFSTNLPDIAGDMISGGYTSLQCDPTKIIAPQAAGCDPVDQIAVECTAMTKAGEPVTITLCSEIKIARD